MYVGIDSYCYHRFFGEVYPEQTPPPYRMSVEDFIKRASELGAEGVSLESCFLPGFSNDYLESVRSMLDEYRLERVFAWGHPNGLEGGKNERAYEDMLKSLEYARILGATVMRVVSSSRRLRHEPHKAQLARLAEMFSKAVKVADQYDIKLAVENHIDFNSDEILELITDVNSPYLGVNYDTGNFVRLLDDPVSGMKKLASHVYATHIKDLNIVRGVPVNEWRFFSSVPVGDGLVDNQQLVQILNDSGYQGLLAVEIDFLHPDYNNDEDGAVAKSVAELKRIVSNIK